MTTDLTLYQVETDLAALIETSEGGVPEELLEEFKQDLIAYTEKAVVKRDRVIHFIRFVENQIAFTAEEEKRLHERKKRLQGALASFMAYVARVVQECAPDMRKGARRLEGKTGTLAAVKNPDSVDVFDAAQLPADFTHIEMRVPGSVIAELPEDIRQTLRRSAVEYAVVPVKANIAQALKAGRTVPGARWKQGEMRLEIR